MSKPKRHVRHYDDEFKLRAVKLYTQTNKSYSELASELRVPSATLVGWVNNPRYSQTSNDVNAHQETTAHELKILRRELAIAQEECNILKKVLAIFSTHPQHK